MVFPNGWMGHGFPNGPMGFAVNLNSAAGIQNCGGGIFLSRKVPHDGEKNFFWLGKSSRGISQSAGGEGFTSPLHWSIWKTLTCFLNFY